MLYQDVECGVLREETVQYLECALCLEWLFDSAFKTLHEILSETLLYHMLHFLEVQELNSMGLLSHQLVKA